jgi:hypothetical protein
MGNFSVRTVIQERAKINSYLWDQSGNCKEARKIRFRISGSGVVMEEGLIWVGPQADRVDLALPFVFNPGQQGVRGVYIPLYQKFMIRFQRLQDLIQWL